MIKIAGPKRKEYVMRCNAYIDPKTKVALEGDAREAASRDPAAPRCGYELEADDTFCPACGASVKISSSETSKASSRRLNNKRATRIDFWISLVPLLLIKLIIFSISGESYSIRKEGFGDNIALKILGYVELIALGYFIRTSVRRLHDIGRSGWWIAPMAFLTILATFSTGIAVVTESTNGVFEIINWAALIVDLGMIGWLGFSEGTTGLNLYGEGVAQDKEEAVKWYRKAAEQGVAEAQFNLGVCYDNGEGVAQDKEEAVKWYRKAAEQGVAEAQYNLGACYANCEGVEQDKKEAMKWLRKAAVNGNENAKGALRKLEEYVD